MEKGTTKKTVYKLVTDAPKHPEKEVTKKPQIIYHTRKPIVHDPPNYDHTIPPEPFPTQPPKKAPATHAPKKTSKPEDYMAVIPYKDVFKLFQMLNKHTKPYDDEKMQKKLKRMTTPLPPPTTKRTEVLQPKVIKRTPLKGKKRKKTVHVRLFFKSPPGVCQSCSLKTCKFI